MPDIPLGLAAYDRLDLPPTILKNLIYEKAPSNQKTQVALIGRPRLTVFKQAGSGPVYGLFKRDGVIGAKTLCLSDDDLYYVPDGAAAAVLILAGLTRDTGAQMTAEGTEDVVVLNTGAASYQTDGVTASAIAMPGSVATYSVDYIAGRFVFASELGRCFYTDAGTLTVDALNYITAETAADNLKSARVINDELWLLGQETTEVWAPTGDVDLPFRQITGRTFSIGCASGASVVRTLDRLFWVGTDRRVYMTNPNPVVISNAFIEEKLRAATGTAYRAFSFSLAAHDLYVVTAPGVGTFAYDVTTGLWSRFTDDSEEGAFDAQVAISTPTGDPRDILGDRTSNQLWVLDEFGAVLGSEEFYNEWTGMVEGTGRCDSVRLFISTRMNTEPGADVQLRLSDDDGVTWTPWIDADVEDTPNGEMATWDRLGLYRHRRIFHWRTDKPRVTVRSADINEGPR
jgi:hypothetical protein